MKESSKIEFPNLDSRDIKLSLRRRYPALAEKYGQTIPGPWTTIEEWKKIDFLSISAVKSPTPGANGSPYPWVGHEIKISRSDMRTELLKPKKRGKGKRFCDAFYFAIPKGMVTDKEKKFKEPNWTERDFLRGPCPNKCIRKRYRSKKKGNSEYGFWNDDITSWTTCPVCKGKGYGEKSLVEKEAPTLWVPNDVGLIEVDMYGFARVAKRAPRLQPNRSRISVRDWNTLIRWTSLRPDPRHEGVIKGLSSKTAEDF